MCSTYDKFKLVPKKAVSSVVRQIAIDAGSLRFDFRGGQVEDSVANGLLLLRHFFRAVLTQALS